MLNLKIFYRLAVKYFTAALVADPVYIRALLCRAEAYTEMNLVKEKLLLLFFYKLILVTRFNH